MNPTQIQEAIVSPKFDHPPVVETAIGIQFDELTNFKAAHFGLYLNHIRDRFPDVQDQPRLGPMDEVFPRRPLVRGIQLQPGHTPDRCWFTSPDDPSHLIQLQVDRFGYNWRRPKPEDTYPSFSESNAKCLKEFGSFLEFCRIVRPRLDEPVPNHCEVVYVNHIHQDAEDANVVDLFAKVFPGASLAHTTDWLTPPEAVTFNRVYAMPENRGRLYAEASVAINPKGNDFILLKMTARVRLKGMELTDGIQLAHDWVVYGFECITDESIRQQRWGQTT